MNLHLVGKHEIGLRLEFEAHAHAFVFDADQRQRTRLLYQLLDVLHPPLAVAAGDKIAQPADDLPGAQRLLGRLVHGVAQGRRAFVGAFFEQPPRSLHVIGDCRQRLVEFVRQRRRHLAQGGQSRHMNEFGLQFLQPGLGLLTFGEIADEAGEEALLGDFGFADRKLEWKRRAVLALADDDPADADDPPLAGELVALQVAVMILPVWRRHQNLDVLSQSFLGAVAEQPLRGRAEGLHDAALVDDDHGIGNSFENGFHVRFTGQRLFGVECRGETRAPQQIAAP